MRTFLGIDLGGTNIKAGVVVADGTVLVEGSTPTPQRGGAEAVLDAMADLGRRLCDQAGVSAGEHAGVGVGVPGVVDYAGGVVKAAPNLDGWRDVAVGEGLKRRLGVRTFLENDANAAAFGEYWAGAAADPEVQDMVMLTLGTGIGTGLVHQGRLIRGATGLGGEGGHMIVQPHGRRCACGQRGCLEQYASATSCVARAREALADTSASSLAELETLNAEAIFAHADRGDALARQIVEETAFFLGVACVSLCRLFDPHMIVFAGGMIAAGDQLFDPVREAFDSLSWNLTADHVRLAPAMLGNRAGFIGAAAVACRAIEEAPPA